MSNISRHMAIVPDSELIPCLKCRAYPKVRDWRLFGLPKPKWRIQGARILHGQGIAEIIVHRRCQDCKAGHVMRCRKNGRRWDATLTLAAPRSKLAQVRFCKGKAA